MYEFTSMAALSRAVLVLLAALAAACSSDDGGGDGGDDAPCAPEEWRRCPCASGGEGVQLCASGKFGACELCAGAGGAGGSSGASGSAGQGGSSGSGAAGSGGSAPGEPTPNPQFLPTPTGACPDFVGDEVTVSPAGIAPRKVRIWIGPEAQQLDGPLVLYWHGTGSSPVFEPIGGLGNPAIDEIKAMGGMVAAPFHDPAAGTFPWFYTAPPGDRDDDARVADEILACAIEKVGIDLRRIHTSGMSAGGLMATQLAYRRSGYMASVVPYSGGRLGAPPNQDPSNKFAAMIYHGGPGDVVVISFQTMSNNFLDDLRANGHFGFICDHGGGHTIPLADVAATWRFMKDHPFGTQPSPYAGGLPAGFPSYCAL